MNRHLPHAVVPPCCLIGLACAAAIGCSSSGDVTRKAEPTRTVAVKTVAVAPIDVQRTTLQPATVHAFYRAEIRARASGYVEKLSADIGDFVEAGSALAQIAVPELRKRREIIEARIRRLEAEEQREQAGVNLAKAKVQSSGAMLDSARSQLSRAEASLAASEAEFSRTEDLVQRGSLQDRMLDEVRMKRDTELASKEAATFSIESAKADVVVAEAQVASAEADLQAAKAETDIARRQLEEADVLIDYATLKAPFSGLVTQRNIEPGQLVREQSEVGDGGPLFVISQVDKVRVRIPVPESDAPLVNPGDSIVLTFPSFASEPAIDCVVTRRSGSLDPSTRTMIVEAELENDDGKLLPGMFGQAKIDLATKIAANMLPAHAIRFDESGKAFVYVVGQDETVSVAQITVGMDDGNAIEVLSGVEPGQRVIGSHLKRFTDGQKVKPL